MREDREFKEFRDVMEIPSTFEEGFGWRTVIMALFVGLLMTPAQLYMNLVAGQSMGDAANWVTVILYVEVARRAFMKLRRPEIFVLFYMCGAVVYTGGGLLWSQFLVQSEEIRKMGITEYIPEWFAPSDPSVLAQRTFFHKAWLMPVGLTLLTMLISRIDTFGLGYIMFRITSDVEKLPFPMAPVGAMGMTALADASNQQDTWRWRTFSIGAMGGILFGFVYLAIPNITGAIFSQPLQILPLPFVDLTTYTETILPAVPMTFCFDLGLIVMGMVLPFWSMVGALIGLVFTWVLNPILYRTGVIDGWAPGVSAMQTINSNKMDFYFSFGLGLSIALAIIGFIHVISAFRKKKGDMDDAGRPDVDWRKLFHAASGRGDFSILVAFGIYLFSTTTYISLSYWLVNYASGPLQGEKFPLWVLLFYGFVYTPIISYVSTRMNGIIGRPIDIPFVREATFIFSGYKGAAIWFAPIPLYNYAAQAQLFKTTELTGTKFTSLIKAEMLIFPIVAVGTVLFAQFIWSIANVPSELFPFAHQFWEVTAYQQGLIYSATLPGADGMSPFQQAFSPEVLGIGAALGLSLYGVMSWFGLPVFLVYGLIGGLDQALPHTVIPMFIGALIGRTLCRKWFGDNWPKYRIVFAAGYTAGVGLITMVSLGFLFMSKSAISLPF